MKKYILNEPDMEEHEVFNKKYENLYIQCGTFEDARFIGCEFMNVEIEGVWVTGALFENCKFKDTLFYDVQSYDAKFKNSKFLNVKFRGCNLSEVDFTGSVLNNVLFDSDNIGSITDISGACFLSVNLSKVNFYNVEYNEETEFSDGFNPNRCKGLIEVKEN